MTTALYQPISCGRVFLLNVQPLFVYLSIRWTWHHFSWSVGLCLSISISVYTILVSISNTEYRPVLTQFHRASLFSPSLIRISHSGRRQIEYTLAGETHLLCAREENEESQNRAAGFLVLAAHLSPRDTHPLLARSSHRPQATARASIRADPVQACMDLASRSPFPFPCLH